MSQQDMEMSQYKVPVVVDCDPGVDDAWALAVLLANKSMEVVAVTVVFGNGQLKETTSNVLRILTHFCRLDVPVYKGSEHSLKGKLPHEDNYFGKDAMGDTKKYPAATGKSIEKMDAPEALVKLARERKGELTLVAIGPLTNIAKALQNDKNFGKNLKEVFIMGGNVEDEGNAGTDHKAEYNFFNDPEAVDYVLKNLDTHSCCECLTCWLPMCLRMPPSKITLVPLKVCLDAKFTWDEYDQLFSACTNRGKFLKDVEALTVKKVKDKAPTGTSYYRCFDQHAALAALYDTKYITQVEPWRCVIELHDDAQHFRGRLVTDAHARPIQLVTGIDKDFLKTVLKETLADSVTSFGIAWA